jgi:hypothetical protein
MERLTFNLIKTPDGWVVLGPDPDDYSQAYLTKDAAFQGAVALIEVAMTEGYEVFLKIPGGNDRFD